MSTSMRNFIKTTGFILIFIGTAGLLLNEFVCEHSTLTIVFAVVNFVGLISLVYGRFWISDKTAS
ncbi:hypothetical protein ES703_103935 [subsurface metagenome]